jgi:hypothetical protein
MGAPTQRHHALSALSALPVTATSRAMMITASPSSTTTEMLSATGDRFEPVLIQDLTRRLAAACSSVRGFRASPWEAREGRAA